jgi:hypothetical protein
MIDRDIHVYMTKTENGSSLNKSDDIEGMRREGEGVSVVSTVRKRYIDTYIQID